MVGLQKVKKIIIAFIIPVILGLMFNNAVNSHYHITPDGVIIKHAHPFSGDEDTNSPIKTHKHTNAENILAFFNHFILLTAIIIGLLFRLFPKDKKQHFGQIILVPQKLVTFGIQSRAPPVLF